MRYLVDADKLHHRRSMAATTAVMLVILAACLIRVDTVCKMQIDALDQVMQLRQEVDKLAETDHIGDADEMICLGEFKISHYCPCAKCCNKTDGITYTGTVATAGRTIGVDPDVIPLGSTVIIDGHEYVAEDIGGGIRDRQIDMFVEGHRKALELGVYRAEVFMEAPNHP